jgi:hypothetical protein
VKVNVLWAVIALIAGLVIGGWGLRTDLRKAKEELKTQKSKSEKSAKRSAELNGIRTMLRLPETKGEIPQIQQKKKDKTETAGQASSNATPAMVARPGTNDLSAASTNRPPKHKSMSEEIKQASELWRTRVALARNSFISNAQLNKDQEIKFDVLVEAMNLRLSDRIEKWADYIKAKEVLAPEDGVRMMNDLSGVLVLTYDEFDRTMPPDWRDKSGENFQLFDLIDPEVAMPLTEVEGILDKSGPAMESQGPFHGRRRHGVNAEVNISTQPK